MTEPTDEADTELMPARVYAESWPDTDREDTFWYQPTGAGIDMRTGAASKITVYIREDVCAADIARLQSELAAAKAELADAQRGDPDGHLLAVYQVLTGSQDAGELFDGEEPHYERVVRAAKEMRAEVERLLVEEQSAKPSERLLLDRAIAGIRVLRTIANHGGLRGALEVSDELLAEYELLTPPSQPTKPVCVSCGDTHFIDTERGRQMCTRCPVPCQACRTGGNGAYCATTPCSCSCHRPAQPTKPEPSEAEREAPRCFTCAGGGYFGHGDGSTVGGPAAATETCPRCNGTGLDAAGAER